MLLLTACMVLLHMFVPYHIGMFVWHDRHRMRARDRKVFMAFASFCFLTGVASIVDDMVGAFSTRFKVMIAISSTRLALYIVSQRRQKASEDQKERDAAQQAAQNNEDEKVSFLAFIMHELRNNLQAVLHIVEQFQHSTRYTSSRDQDDLHAAEMSIDMMLHLTNDLLDMNKLDAGRMQLVSEPVNVPELLRTLHGLHVRQVRSGHVQFLLKIDPSVPTHIMADKKRLMQILTNFISNAIKFTTTGSINLHATVKQLNHLVFQVKDTGPGIDDEQMKHIFKPYAQAKLRFRQCGGTGLGLALCKKLAELMNGEITIDTKMNVGTTISLVLPYHPTVVSTITPATTPLYRADDQSQVKHQRARRTILIVDDNDIVRKMLKHTLVDAGYNICEAKDGMEAVELVRRDSIHLITMDISMPKMDGYMRAMQIRKEGSRIPILALTALDSENQRNLAIQAGMNDMLRKPIKRAQLIAAIDSMLL